jgi:hypothetical protein
VGFQAVEEGLCEGIAERMAWCPGQPNHPRPTRRRLPHARPTTTRRLEDDPDAVFFKRQRHPTHSPVIPFYWGYRDIPDDNRRATARTWTPTATASTRTAARAAAPSPTPPPTWPTCGTGAPVDGGFIDWLSGDPIRPVLKGPGRMYFVLAAQRLAALVRMIRKYDANDTVNIVAHSQGCLIALLAQAFLMEDGHRPPTPWCSPIRPTADQPRALQQRAAEDAAMKQLYAGIDGLQTVRARLDTLVNIVKGVAAQRRDGWSADAARPHEASGLHSTAWKPGEDRDNRGKVYLYFCPEDMTVALRNVQGIGWQGVPDQLMAAPPYVRPTRNPQQLGKRKPLQELGPASCSGCSPQIRAWTASRPPFQVGLDLPFHPAWKASPTRPRARDITTLRTHLPEAAPAAPPARAGASSTASACPSPTPPTSTPGPVVRPEVQARSRSSRRPHRRRRRRQPRPGLKQVLETIPPPPASPPQTRPVR